MTGQQKFLLESLVAKVEDLKTHILEDKRCQQQRQEVFFLRFFSCEGSLTA